MHREVSLRKIRLPSIGDRTVPLALAVAALLAYGTVLPSLGFYWDDWPNAWFLHIMGPLGFPISYASDRPFLGYLYILTTPWLGENPLLWQAFGLVCRWLSALAVWWLLRMIWPERKREVAWVALLFVVYPSFKQQHVSIIYSHFFLLLAIHLASVGLTVTAIRSPGRAGVLTAVALAAEAVSLFSVEYFVSVEVLRPILVWLVLRREGRHEGRRTLLQIAWPYLAILAGYLFWRSTILGYPTYQPILLQDFTDDPSAAVAGLLSRIGPDIRRVLFSSWSAAVRPATEVHGRRGLLLLVGSAVTAFVLIGLFLAGYSRRGGSDIEPERARSPRWPAVAALLGLVMMLAGGATAWFTNLPIGLDFPWDRLTLPMMLGASLILAAGLSVIDRVRGLAPALLAALIALAVTSHASNALRFRLDWLAQRDFFWQLAWRVPSLQPGTVLLTNDIPLTYESDNSLTAPLNWIYTAGPPERRMDYLLYFVSVRVGLGLPSLGLEQPIEQWYRATTFHGDTSQSVAVLKTPHGCLQVLDEIYHDSMPTIPRLLSEAVPLTSLEWIDADAAPPRDVLLHLFGPEPAHTWCYDFEQADLARQRGDWERVVQIGDQTLVTGDEPNDASEWLPFIEANARTGRLKKAVDITRSSFDQNPAVVGMLCRTWGRIAPDLETPSDRAIADQMLGELSCTE